MCADRTGIPTKRRLDSFICLAEYLVADSFFYNNVIAARHRLVAVVLEKEICIAAFIFRIIEYIVFP